MSQLGWYNKAHFALLFITSLIGCAAPVEKSNSESESIVRTESEILVAEHRCQTWRVQDSFTAAETATFFAAAARWNAWLGYERFTIATEGCPIIKRTLIAEHAITYFRYNDSSLSVDLNAFEASFPKNDPETLELLIMHEFGHAAGFNHVERGIMGAGRAHLATDFTFDDRVECIRIGLCQQ